MWVKDAVQLLYGSKDNGQGEKYWKSANELCWIKKQYVTENIFSLLFSQSSKQIKLPREIILSS